MPIGVLGGSTKENPHVLIHGMARAGEHAPEYWIWMAIKARCLNPKNRRYTDYGGRGITMAQEWVSDFPAFIRHVGMRPDPSLTLDRIDNEKGYEPGNIRWATRIQQARNCRSNVWITFEGKTLIATDWAKLTGQDVSNICKKFRQGLPVEVVLKRQRRPKGVA